ECSRRTATDGPHASSIRRPDLPAGEEAKLRCSWRWARRCPHRPCLAPRAEAMPGQRPGQSGARHFERPDELLGKKRHVESKPQSGAESSLDTRATESSRKEDMMERLAAWRSLRSGKLRWTLRRVG